MASLDDLLEKKKQLEAKIQKEKAKISKASRAEDTRRKILVGAFVMQNEEQYKNLLKSKAFDQFIVRGRDRKLFELSSIESSDADPNA